MMIKHGMVLAAGLGKRMQPLTLKTPKPLLEINNISLLERAINLLINSGVEEIIINVHHLPEQIEKFIREKKFKAQVNISKETDVLLDTGGGVLEATKHFGDNPFYVINPDTLWSDRYIEEAKRLEDSYSKNKKLTLLLVNKKLSFDGSFKGDFNLSNNQISRDEKNEFIFTGLQIINRNFLTSENSKVFSMNKIWNDLIVNKELYGIESNLKFYHLNTHEMYLKISNLKITD
jgi:MurNAc alpha-1-phosphate uridylyltransferase